MKPDNLALKFATAEMIKGCDGLENAAEHCRVGKSVLGDNQSINKPDSFIALDVVRDLERLSRDREGWPHVTLELCKSMGGTFVPLPEVPVSTAGVHMMLGDMSKEFGEATAAVCTGLADGVLSDSDIAKSVKELDDVIRVAASMRALLLSGVSK
jgi:hypothetical protein